MKKIIIFSLIFSMIAPSISFAKINNTTNNQENLFYYYDNHYGYSEFRKNYRDIDIIAPQVYTVDYDLNIKGPSKNEKKLLKYAKQKRVDIMPLIVNADFSKVLMSDILINEKAQDKIIDFLIAEAKKEKYIGWQFDFENINHLDRDLYTNFVKKAYKRFQEEKLQFSVAVIVRNKPYDKESKDQDWSSAYDYAEIGKNADFVTLMSYDDPNSIGPVASLPYLKKVLDFTLPQIPAEKVSLGVPAYCWRWQEATVNSAKVRKGATTYGLAEKAYKKDRSATKGFDETLGAEWFRYKQDGVNYETWCDSKKSFEIKQQMVDEYNLRGISVWALGQADKNIWKLF